MFWTLQEVIKIFVFNKFKFLFHLIKIKGVCGVAIMMIIPSSCVIWGRKKCRVAFGNNFNNMH
jgi:hypothetical protein